MQGLGASGGLAVLWNPLTANSQLIQQESNWQMIHIIAIDISFILINVYGPASSLDKACLWEVILTLYYLNPRKLEVLSPPKMLQAFNAFVDNNNLMDVHPNNGVFT